MTAPVTGSREHGFEPNLEITPFIDNAKSLAFSGDPSTLSLQLIKQGPPPREQNCTPRMTPGHTTVLSMGSTSNSGRRSY